MSSPHSPPTEILPPQLGGQSHLCDTTRGIRRSAASLRFAAKPGHRGFQAWTHARKATKRTLSVQQQRLHNTNAAPRYRSQFESHDLCEVKCAQRNEAMKSHQIGAHIRYHTPHVIHCLEIRIPSMQPVGLAECSWSMQPVDLAECSWSSVFCLQDNPCSNLCMFIRPWLHAAATVHAGADLDREQGQLAYSKVGHKHGKGRCCCKAGHQQQCPAANTTSSVNRV